MTSESDSTKDADVEVIDAEFIDASDDDAPDDKGRTPPRWGLRIGWTLAAVLAVFITGLFAASHVDRGLAWFGLSLPRPAAQQDQDPAGPGPDMSGIMAGLDRLDRRVAALETAMAEIDRAVESNRQDIAAVRRAPPAGADDGTVPPAFAATAEDVAVLTDRLTTLENRVTALAEDFASAPEPVSQSAVASLQTALSEAGEARRRLSERLEALDRRLAVVETAERGAQVRPSLALVLPRLARAVDRGASFAAELAAVREVLRDAAGPTRSAAQPAIDALAPHAASGLADRTALAGDFAAVARAVQAADTSETGEAGEAGATGETGGFWATLGRRLGSVIAVRRVDEAAEGRDRILAEAEAALDRGDLAGAVAVLEALAGPAREAAAPWLDRARDRLAAEAALDDLVDLASPGGADAVDLNDPYEADEADNADDGGRAGAGGGTDTNSASAAGDGGGF